MRRPRPRRTPQPQPGAQPPRRSHRRHARIADDIVQLRWRVRHCKRHRDAPSRPGGPRGGDVRDAGLCVDAHARPRGRARRARRQRARELRRQRPTALEQAAVPAGPGRRGGNGDGGRGGRGTGGGRRCLGWRLLAPPSRASKLTCRAATGCARTGSPLPPPAQLWMAHTARPRVVAPWGCTTGCCLVRSKEEVGCDEVVRDRTSFKTISIKFANNRGLNQRA
jgi:hypothetical protein